MTPPTGLPATEAAYLTELSRRVEDVIGEDLLGLWLIGSAAQGDYEPGVSDLDVLAVSRNRHPEVRRQDLGAHVVHPALPCPAVGLEFVWYALPDLDPPADPVAFQLNVNGGPDRPSAVQLAPDDSANYWSVLDLAAVRQVGLPIRGPQAAAVIPPLPADRVEKAIRESVAWHDGPDAGSPNRVLNLARLLILRTEGRWGSKVRGAAELGAARPELAPVLDEALRARAEKRRLDPELAAPLSALLAEPA